MALTLCNALKAAEWSKHKPILSKHTGIGDKLKQLEAAGKTYDEDEPDDVKGVLEIVSDLLGYVFKAKDKKFNWPEKTTDWLEEMDKAARKLQGELKKQLPEALAIQHRKAEDAAEEMMMMERAKKLKGVLARMPNAVVEGADLKQIVALMRQSGMDVSKFSNVNAIADAYDSMMKGVADLESLEKQLAKPRVADEKEPILEKFRKECKDLESAMDELAKAGAIYSGELRSWQSEFSRDEDLKPLLSKVNTLFAQFESKAKTPERFLKNAVKVETRTQMEIDAAEARAKYLKDLADKLPSSLTKGIHLKETVSKLGDAGLDMRKFANVNAIATSFDEILEEGPKFGKLLKNASGSTDVEEKEAILASVQKTRKRLEGLMETVVKAGEDYSTELRNWQSKFRDDEAMKPLLSWCNGLFAHFEVLANGPSRYFRESEKEETKVEQQIAHLYATTELEPAR